MRICLVRYRSCNYEYPCKTDIERPSADAADPNAEHVSDHFVLIFIVLLLKPWTPPSPLPPWHLCLLFPDAMFCVSYLQFVVCDMCSFESVLCPGGPTRAQRARNPPAHNGLGAPSRAQGARTGPAHKGLGGPTRARPQGPRGGPQGPRGYQHM